VQTKDDRGCPGCPRCLELEFGMEDEHEVNEALNTYIDEVLASADQNTKPTCPKLDCPKLDCRSQTIGFDANYCLMVSISNYSNTSVSKVQISPIRASLLGFER
jgi:hypothetical protein